MSYSLEAVFFFTRPVTEGRQKAAIVPLILLLMFWPDSVLDRKKDLPALVALAPCDLDGVEHTVIETHQLTISGKPTPCAEASQAQSRNVAVRNAC